MHLEALDLVSDRGGQRIIDGVSFEVEADEWVSLVGPSGAGKSTLLRLLNRLDEPDEGTIQLDGVDYRKIEPTILRQQVGLVAQDPALQPGTIMENITIGPRLRDEPIPKNGVSTILNGLGLAQIAERKVNQLSGGEASRVMLARTLVNGPEVVLLDEPTASLDPDTTKRVEALLTRTLRADECSVILVTHDQDQAARLGERTLKLHNGRLSSDTSQQTKGAE